MSSSPFGAGSLDSSNGEAPDQSLPDPLPADPFGIFGQWFDEAQAAKRQPNPNAMTLATIAEDGRPTARIVLCKGIDAAAGTLTFFTNYESDKGRSLAKHPRAAVVFHWDAFERQVRIEGPVALTTGAESDEYFASRPWVSRIGAWASRQSQPLDSRDTLVLQAVETMMRFNMDPFNPPALDAKVHIDRPPHWGGYRLWADRVELWVASTGRLHDRARWTRELVPASAGPTRTFTPVAGWTSTRVQP